MNAGLAKSLESFIGPPSEPISISDFLRSDLTTTQLADADTVLEDVAEECSVSEIKEMLQVTWDNVKLSGQLLKDHELLVTNAIIAGDNKKKRRRIVNFEEPTSQPSQLKRLQDSLSLVGRNLKSWPYPPESALFMRAPKNTDTNVLMQVKSSGSALSQTDQSSSEAILSITFHNPLSWGHNYLSRTSTHLLRSSHTLADLYNLLICATIELPEEIMEEGEFQGYLTDCSPVSPSCVVCIEGLAYPGGSSEVDYADKLLEQIGLLPEDKRPSLAKAPTKISTTPLGSLTLRINEPYYVLHQGNCEHFFVVDNMRLQKPSENLSQYPLTTHVTPVLLDLCRSCCKVPAVWAIVGDTRLPESPCVMCQPCWNNMGISGDNDVCVVPLPKHIHGWKKYNSTTLASPIRVPLN